MMWTIRVIDETGNKQDCEGLFFLLNSNMSCYKRNTGFLVLCPR